MPRGILRPPVGLRQEEVDSEIGWQEGIGSWIEVKVGDLTLRREVTSGGGHIGGQLSWIHFGLGPASSAHVRVQWPNGEIGPWIDVAANGFDQIDRGATSAKPWVPTEP